ncbi:MAG: hypothetical protein GY950_17565 [bacterium]|nr:hypothetical protein [bacterium]
MLQYTQWNIDRLIWLPPLLFDIIGGPGGKENILGVTFTFVWNGPDGNPSDIDNNGKDDTAFREVYYNNYFLWADSVPGYADAETIILHENGHSLSIGHFGKLFKTDANGKFHFAPRVVMNAGYTGPMHEIKGTDKASFCSIWASWPNN